MEPVSVCELPQCPSPAPEKLSWGEIMDELDNEMENVQPFCFYNPWSMVDMNQVEEQKVEKVIEEQKAEEQAIVQQLPVKNTKLPDEPLSTSNTFQSEAISNLLPTVEPESVSEPPQCPSPAPAKLSWGEIMDAEDKEMENVQPFCFYDPWSLVDMIRAERQKAQKPKVEKKAEEQKVEEQASVQQLPVSDKNLPSLLCKNKKTVKLLLRNLDLSVDDRQLHEEFSPFGTVISAEVNMKNGRPKGTGFVIFESSDEARNAFMKMNGRVLGSRPVFIIVVQSKGEDVGRQRARAESSLPSERVICAKVTVDNGVRSVSFSSSSEAGKANRELNGRSVGRRPVYVTLDNSSNQRKVSLSSHRRPSVAPATR